jgi:hypothetical protein
MSKRSVGGHPAILQIVRIRLVKTMQTKKNAAKNGSLKIQQKCKMTETQSFQ